VSGIFLNYRYSPGRVLIVSAMHRFLVHHFGADQVFMDRQMPTGARYPTEIRRRLAEADVLVAVIHDCWLDGCRGEGDWVYDEIKAAIDQGKHLVQVVLADARRLRVKDLEERFPDLRELAVRQAHKLEDLERDMANLAKDLEGYITSNWKPQQLPAPRDRPQIAYRLMAALGVAALVPLFLAASGILTTIAAAGICLAMLLLSISMHLTLLASGVAMMSARRRVHRFETRPLFAQPLWRRLLDAPLLMMVSILGLMMALSYGSKLPQPVFIAEIAAWIYWMIRTLTRLRDKEKAADDQWPIATTGADLGPAALHADVCRLRARLEQWDRPLARHQRDQATWVLARLDQAVGRLTDAARQSRPSWLACRIEFGWVARMYTLAGTVVAGTLITLWMLALAANINVLFLAITTAICAAICVASGEIWYQYDKKQAEVLATEIRAAVTEIRGALADYKDTPTAPHGDTGQ
jgi:hypothetical protein